MSSDLDEFTESLLDEKEDDCENIEAPLRTASVQATPSHEVTSSTDKNMWASSGTDFFPCESAVDKLPPGQYLIRHSDSSGFYFSKKNINLDELITLPDNNTEKVLNTIDHFWRQEKKFREFGFLWKRGIMLWGPPGSGKTSAVQQLAKQIVELGGISIYCTYPGNDAEGLRILRNIESVRPIVVIIEDIDAIIQRHGEAELLAMLDGELQIDNVVFIATTNYPERLDKRFINRPSRFDEVIKIGMPSAICREVYLRKKNPTLSKENLEHWVSNTENFSIAHLRELIVAVECLGNNIDESITRLRKMNDISIKSSDNDRGLGFMSDK